jgi:chemotaxis regulatin CheY-phosphate phosphatase CheZ
MLSTEKKLVNGLLDFSEQSLDWCIKESEKSTTRISEVIDHLMTDAKRVSNMPKETLEAFNQAKAIAENLHEKGGRGLANQIGSVLQGMSEKDHQIEELVMPIVESLQVQDRITQNINHMAKIIRIWQETRSEVMKTQVFSEADKLALGNTFADLVTMEAEKECIANHIPIKVERVVDDGDCLFF